MATVDWPGADRRKLIGARISRLDGPAKATGRARYAYDINREDMLHAKLLQAQPAAARVLEVDTSAAEAMPGVEAVYVVTDRRSGELPTITYQGDIVAAVAARTEEIALEALGKIKVTYEKGEPVMDDTDIDLASGRDQEKEEGDPAAAFAEADVVSEGKYGIAAITHCCLEAHGQVMEIRDGELYVWPSTQSVSGYAGGLTRIAEMSTDKIHVDCQYMGGGFGSKFAADAWGEICVHLTKMTGKPVKLMLERDQELMVAGARPSAFAEVKVGVKNDGTVVAWDSTAWGSGGQQRWRMPPLPYVFNVPNYKTLGRGIVTNRGLTRAWRAPNHPQAALITMSAMEDAAAALGMNPVDFFKVNVATTERPEVYREQIDTCADMIEWQRKWHKRGESGEGPLKRGVGMSIHTWGGMGHPSNCSVTINPDGSVVGRMGTQDLGTGTRTTTTIVLAETLGLPMDRVRMEIGRNAYPESGASGGSSTIGGVSSSSRDAGTQALNALLEKVAPELGVTPDKLEAWQGNIQEIGNPSNKMSWDDACGLLDGMPLTRSGSNPTTDGTDLTTNGVGGVQMADVSVDVGTGVVTINEFAAVQDCGLVIDLKTCESQMYGAVIMGITYALYEECVYDMTTGAMLNPDMEFYRLAGLGDIGAIKVHLQTDEKHTSRGVIGIGEPPVISPGAAISNAVANALGVRVPNLPLTPDRVLNALSEEGVLG